MADRTITLHAKTTSDGRGMLEAARDLEKTADGVDRLGSKMRLTSEHSRRLGGQIEETARKVADLRHQIAATGDMSLFGDLGKQERNLRRLQRLASNLTPGGGGNLLSSIPRIGGVPGPLIAGGAAAAVALSPAIGATVAAAVLGGVGTGGLIGGIALATQDTRVQAAFKDLGQEVFKELSDTTSPLVKPLVDSAHQFGDAWRKERPEFERNFAVLSKAVDPITEGLIGFVHNLGPGLRSAFRASIPLAEQFGEELERFGGTTSDFLIDMAQSAGGAKIALHDLFTVLDSGFDILGGGIEILSKTYEVGRKFGMIAPPEFFFNAGPIIGTWQLLNPELEKSVNNLKDMLTPTEELARAHEDAADAAKKQKDALEKLNKQVDDYFDSIASRHGAAREWEDAWDDLHDAIRENGRTLDITTEAGRANAEALDRAAVAARGLLETGQITEEQYRRRIELIEAEAIRLGISTTAVHALLDEYLKIPSQIITELIVRAPGLQAAFNMVRYLAGGKVPLSTGEHSGGQVGMLVGSTAGRPGPGHGAFLDLPTRDSGGPVAPGKSYLIGGRPEILTMGSMGGHVTPMSASGRTVVEFRSDGTRVGDLLLELFSVAVGNRGGNVQVAVDGVRR